MDKAKLNIPWRALTLLGALLLIWIIFTATTGGTFVTPRNLSLLLRQMSCTSILAIGMVLVIVCAEIDLSVGAMTGFLGALSAILFINHGWPLCGQRDRLDLFSRRSKQERLVGRIRWT